MAILIPRKNEFWQRKPTGLVEIDWGHELSVGLVDLITPESHDLAKSTVSDSIDEYDADGLGFSCSASSAGFVYKDEIVVSNLDNSTVTLVFGNDSVTAQDTLYAERNTGNPIFKVTTGISSPDKLSFVFRNDGGNLINLATQVDMDTSLRSHFGAYITNGTNSRSIYCDGNIAENTSNYNNTLTTSNKSRICSDAADIGTRYSGGVMMVGLYSRSLLTEELDSLNENPYQPLKPRRKYWVLPAAAAGTTATLTGTITTADEADIVAGGKTIILTLTGDTWVAAGATFDAQRQPILDGLTSAQTETTGWNNEVRDKEVVTAVARTSDTVVTITLSAQSGFDITADDNITDTIPAAALVTSASAVVATPTFTVSFVASGFQAAWAMASKRSGIIGAR